MTAGAIGLLLTFSMSLLLLTGREISFGAVVFLLFINSFLWGAAVEAAMGYVQRWRERRRE